MIDFSLFAVDVRSIMGTQTWDDCVADASWSTEVLVYGRYLPDFISLRRHRHTHTKKVCLKNILLIVPNSRRHSDVPKMWKFVFVVFSFPLLLKRCSGGWSDWHREKSVCFHWAFVPQSDTMILKKKNPVLKRNMMRPSVPSDFLPLFHTHAYTHAHSHTHVLVSLPPIDPENCV